MWFGLSTVHFFGISKVWEDGEKYEEPIHFQLFNFDYFFRGKNNKCIDLSWFTDRVTDFDRVSSITLHRSIRWVVLSILPNFEPTVLISWSKLFLK
jgi:hypothetical protein